MILIRIKSFSFYKKGAWGPLLERILLVRISLAEIIKKLPLSNHIALEFIQIQIN